MKKLFVFAASAMMVFASCTDNEIVYQNETPQEIGLFSVVDNMTRANVQGAQIGNTFPFENMQVAAYLAQNPGTTAKDYFDGTTFSSAGTSFTGGKYWPIQDAVINFMAIAPVEDDKVETVFGETSGNDKINYANKATVTVTGNYANQYDVMYAVGQGIKTSTTIPTVGMTFKHALAWVNFTVKSSSPGITINSITITDGKYSGTLTVTNSNYNSTNASDEEADDYKALEAVAEWSATAEQDKEVVGDAVIFVDDDEDTEEVDESNLSTAIDWGKGILVVPCNPTSFVVNYTITADGENHEYNYTYTIADETAPATAWAMGKKYTYNISMSLSQIQIDPDVTEWDEEDEVTVPVN